MLDPSFFTRQDEMRRLHRLMTEPCPSRSPEAVITDWGIDVQEDSTLRMQGVVSPYSMFEDETLVTTQIWQLNTPERLMRTSERWITLGRAYHEDMPPDIEMEAVGPGGYFIAPCIAERYLTNIRSKFEQELTKY